MYELKFAFRQLAKNSGFTAVAVLTLALGIGAATAVFSVVSGVLLKPMPYAEPWQLVNLWEEPRGTSQGRHHVAGGVFLAWKEQATVFEDLSVIHLTDLNLTGDNPPERLAGAAVSASYLRILRADFVVGRGFLPSEDNAGEDNVVVLSHGLWQRRFGGATNLAGQTIRLGGHARTVVGVLPPHFHLSNRFEFLIPFVFGLEPWSTAYDDSRFEVIARLKSGRTIEQARAELQTISQRLQAIRSESGKDWGVSIRPLGEAVTERVESMLWIFFGAVGFVLLMACANVANLLLARSAAREKEMAVRAALGAGRGRIVRQRFTESLLLAILGGLAGLLVAFWGVAWLSHLGADSLPRAQEVRLDLRVLGFSLLMSLACGFLFGLVPSVRLSVLDLNRTLRGGARPLLRGSLNGLRGALVISETGLALVLLVGAGLLLRSFVNLEAAPLGFNPSDALVAEITLPEKTYADANVRASLFQQILERLETQPGVQSAGLAGSLPLITTWELGFQISGRPAVPDRPLYADYDFCSPGYLEALGVPLLRGRFLTARDDARAPRVALVDESFANRYFPNQDPLGQRLEAGGAQWEIVGVVGNLRHRRFVAEFRPRVYAPLAFSPSTSAYLLVRTAGPLVNLAETIRKQVSEIDPEQPVSSFRTLEQVVSDSVKLPRISLILLGLFGAISLLLAAIGLYGVMAFSVSQRTRELGVRIALGAQLGDVRRLVLNQGLRLTLVGLVIGSIGALALTRLIRSQLYEVGAADPIAFAGVSILLILVALIASYLPARRATKVDPMEALRQE